MLRNLDVILRSSVQKLSTVSSAAALEAEVLLAQALDKTRAFVLAHPEHQLSPAEANRFARLLKRRLKGEPLAYVLGHQEFYGLDFLVNKNVLVPRPETELLVEEMLTEPMDDSTAIIDLGTGSGAIIISLAKNIKADVKFIAIDLSIKALNIALKNSKLQKINKRIKFLQGDLLQPALNDPKIRNYLQNSKIQKLKIAANLPYIPSAYLDKLDTPDTIPLKFEPRLALDGGPDGLDLYRHLAKQLTELVKLYPKMKIKVFAEIQPGQGAGMRKIFGPQTKIIKDYCHKDRLAIITS
ncbi:MAG: peptide chain release factor N(5)-glutamine methyltransferase [Candidatus Falkowbacteria bacterium]